MEIVLAIILGVLALAGIEGNGRRAHEREMAKLNYHQTTDKDGFKTWQPNSRLTCSAMTEEK